MKLLSPPYETTMVCCPIESVEVDIEAVPPLNIPVPKLVPPSKNVTVPPGVPEPGLAALTVAMRVTLCPKTEAFTEEDTDSLVDAWLTD